MQFVAWVLGQNQDNKVIVSTYNEKYSSKIGRGVRDLIGTKGSGGGEDFCYREFFPNVKINRKDSSKTMWSLEGKHFNFLATSPKGTSTGVGADYLIIDDIIKSHTEAMSSTFKEETWEWYVNTLQSRMEKGCRVIVVNTRWAVDDIGGRLYESEKGRWKRIIYPAYYEETGEMLCDDIKEKDEFLEHMEKSKQNKHSWAIFRANYFQEPVSFSVSNIFNAIPFYDKLPTFDYYLGYIDVANGGDYLCFCLVGVYEQQLYLVDVLYEQDKIEVTIPKILAILNKHTKKASQFTHVQVETNGAIGFYNLLQEKIIEEELGIILEQKHNKESKVARINNALLCANLYYRFPEDIYLTHENFYSDLISYNPTGRNKHDDAPDCIAGLLKFFMDKYLESNDNFKGW